jgi:hypothetical protein
VTPGRILTARVEPFTVVDDEVRLAVVAGRQRVAQPGALGRRDLGRDRGDLGALGGIERDRSRLPGTRDRRAERPVRGRRRGRSLG